MDIDAIYEIRVIVEFSNDLLLISLDFQRSIE